METDGIDATKVWPMRILAVSKQSICTPFISTRQTAFSILKTHRKLHVLLEAKKLKVHHIVASRTPSAKIGNERCFAHTVV